MPSNKQDKLSISICGLHNIEKNRVNINDTLIVHIHIARKPAYTKDVPRASSSHMHRIYRFSTCGIARLCGILSVGTRYNCK